MDILPQSYQESLRKRTDAIGGDRDLRPRKIAKYVIDLSTARDASSPFEINEAFDAFFVEAATDNNTLCSMILTSGFSDATRNPMVLKKNSEAEFSEPTNRALITNAAQSGKTITILLFMGVKYRSGQLLSELTGGVIVTTGTGMTPQTKVSVGVAATQIFASDSTRKKATIQNIGGNRIFISGTNTVTLDSGTLPGIILDPGDVYEWINTGACYGIADGAACDVSINTET